MTSLENWTKEFKELADPLLRQAEPWMAGTRDAHHIGSEGSSMEGLNAGLVFDEFLSGE